MPTYASILKFDEAKHPRDAEGQFTQSGYTDYTSDFFNVRGKSPKHVQTIVEKYGLKLTKIEPDLDGEYTVTVEGRRPYIEHLIRDTE